LRLLDAFPETGGSVGEVVCFEAVPGACNESLDYATAEEVARARVVGVANLEEVDGRGVFVVYPDADGKVCFNVQLAPSGETQLPFIDCVGHVPCVKGCFRLLIPEAGPRVLGAVVDDKATLVAVQYRSGLRETFRVTGPALPDELGGRMFMALVDEAVVRFRFE
jgi:hypothetical protein